MRVSWIGPHLVVLGQARFTGVEYDLDDAVATELLGRGLVSRTSATPLASASAPVAVDGLDAHGGDEDDGGQP